MIALWLIEFLLIALIVIALVWAIQQRWLIEFFSWVFRKMGAQEIAALLATDD